MYRIVSNAEFQPEKNSAESQNHTGLVIGGEGTKKIGLWTK